MNYQAEEANDVQIETEGSRECSPICMSDIEIYTWLQSGYSMGPSMTYDFQEITSRSKCCPQ